MSAQSVDGGGAALPGTSRCSSRPPSGFHVVGTTRDGRSPAAWPHRLPGPRSPPSRAEAAKPWRIAPEVRMARSPPGAGDASDGRRGERAWSDAPSRTRRGSDPPRPSMVGRGAARDRMAARRCRGRCVGRRRPARRIHSERTRPWPRSVAGAPHGAGRSNHDGRPATTAEGPRSTTSSRAAVPATRQRPGAVRGAAAAPHRRAAAAPGWGGVARTARADASPAAAITPGGLGRAGPGARRARARARSRGAGGAPWLGGVRAASTAAGPGPGRRRDPAARGLAVSPRPR